MSGTSSRELSRAPSPSVAAVVAAGGAGGENGGNIVIPYPVSVSLRNQFVRDPPPPSSSRRRGSSSSSSRGGGRGGAPLLLPTVLEIYREADEGGDQARGVEGLGGLDVAKGIMVDETGDGATVKVRDDGSACGEEDVGRGVRVIYRANHHPALNPRWDDLGDAIDGGGGGDEPLTSLLLGSDRDAYKSVRVRVRTERGLQLEEDEQGGDSDREQDEEGGRINDEGEGDDGHDEADAMGSLEARLERPQSLKVTLADLPLYPGALRRLPGRHRHHHHQRGSGGATADFSDPTVPPPPHHRFIPALPPNALLVEYSDGYTRVDPTVYDLLVTAGVVVPSHHHSEDAVGRDADDGEKVGVEDEDDDDDEDDGGDDELERDYAEEQERLAVRFSDDAFDALLPEPGPTTAATTTTDMGLVVTTTGVDDGFVQPGGSGLGWNPGSEAPVSPTHDNSATAGWADCRGVAVVVDNENDGPISGGAVVAIPSNLGDDDEQRGANDGDRRGDGAAKVESKSEDGEIPVLTVAESSPRPAKDTEKIRGIRLREEVRRLESILAAEEEAVSSSLRAASREASTLRRTIDDAVRLEGEVETDVASIGVECDRLATSHFVLETRRAKLLGELRRIYPIQCLRSPPSPGSTDEDDYDRRYAIRGLEVPRDLGGQGASSHHHHHHSAAAYDDAHLSSALGFVCHLVFMCSKYLGIPLRYRLICNSSRSAVAVSSSSPPRSQPNDDGAEVAGSKGAESTRDGTSAASSPAAASGVVCYPLFRDGVAPELFGRAVVLLERDIECLLKKRGIPYVPRSHMLAKLDRLFEQTIRGSGGGVGGG